MLRNEGGKGLLTSSRKLELYTAISGRTVSVSRVRLTEPEHAEDEEEDDDARRGNEGRGVLTKVAIIEVKGG